MLKYKMLKRKMSDLLNTLGAEEPLPPIKELMSRYGVSLTTVNKALEELEAGGRITRRRGSGIFSNRDKRTAQGKIIECFFSVMAGYEQLFQGISEVAHRNGMRLFLHYCPEGVEGVRQTIADRIDEGIRCAIVLPTTGASRNQRYIASVQQLSQKGIPVVVVGIPLPGVQVADYIEVDNQRGFQTATEQLARHKCGKFCFVGNTSSVPVQARLAGVREALKAGGNDIVVVEADSRAALGPVARRVVEAAPDAVFLGGLANGAALCYELLLAYGGREKLPMVAGVVQEGGRLPIEDAITIEVPTVTLGRRAAELALRPRKEKGLPVVEFLPIKILKSGAEKQQ